MSHSCCSPCALAGAVGGQLEETGGLDGERGAEPRGMADVGLGLRGTERARDGHGAAGRE